MIKAIRHSGSTYKDSTIRTHVVSHLLEDGTLIRSGPGRYRLARHRERPAEPPTPSPTASIDRIPRPGEGSPPDHLEAGG